MPPVSYSVHMRRSRLAALAYVIGTGIHFFFSLVWGVLFAWIWPYFRDRGYESDAGSAVLRSRRLDRDACRDRGCIGQPPQLSGSGGRHWRLHVALLLHGAAGTGREAKAQGHLSGA